MWYISETLPFEFSVFGILIGHKEVYNKIFALRKENRIGKDKETVQHKEWKRNNQIGRDVNGKGKEKEME